MRLPGAADAQFLAGPTELEALRAWMGVAFDRSGSAMLLVDDGQRIRCANPTASKVLAADLVGRSALEFGFPRLTGQADPDVAGAFGADGAERERGAWLVTGRGLRVRAMLTVETLAAPSGERLFFLQWRDVTVEADGVAALADGELRYRQLAGSLPGISVVTFDRELRVSVAVGDELARHGYAPLSLPGRLLNDVLPGSALAVLEEPYRAALAGGESDFDYTSPVSGRQYRTRVRPITTVDGVVSGGLALTEDLTAEQTRQHLLEEIQKLSQVGTCCYDTSTGWIIDDTLLDLMGIEPGEDVIDTISSRVLAEDRERVRAAYRGVIAVGGRVSLRYRLHHGRTGELRYIAGACQAVVDPDGALLRAIVTHADVTDAVRAETARAGDAQARLVLLRRVGQALAVQPGSVREVMQKIADVASAAPGNGTVVRVFTPDRQQADLDVVSHFNDDHAPAALDDSLLTTMRAWRPGPEQPGDDRLWSSIDNHQWRTDFALRTGNVAHSDIAHVISAPIRHDDSVLGFVRVFRVRGDDPYQTGDDDVVQVLADRIGSAVAEQRIRDQLELQRLQGRAVADRLQELTVDQRELLEQLADVEDRERMLLAEAIHDEPMQLIVAAMLRIEAAIGNPEAKDPDEIEQTVHILDVAVQKLRTLIIALTPPDLQDGLGVALLRLAEGIFVGKSTQITVHGIAHVSLTPLRKVNAHRILREALVNARKHASANHLELSLEEHNGIVTARLSDDGVGAAHFDPSPGHIGMATMHARARAESGHLDVQSVAGQGTTITLTLPVNAPTRHAFSTQGARPAQQISGETPSAPAHRPLR